MSSFEQTWASARRYRRISPRLERFLEAVHHEVVKMPADLESLSARLEELLRFLASEEGRTDANCSVTDRFFSLLEEERGGWSHLPPAYGSILHDLGATLHETIYAPRIAANFSSLPEQLLERVFALPRDSR